MLHAVGAQCLGLGFLHILPGLIGFAQQDIHASELQTGIYIVIGITQFLKLVIGLLELDLGMGIITFIGKELPKAKMTQCLTIFSPY